jgi:hypothetical protein
MSILPVTSAGLDNVAAVERATIPVERAAGPLLLVSGGDDGVWPASRLCAAIVDRMTKQDDRATSRISIFRRPATCCFRTSARRTACIRRGHSISAAYRLTRMRMRTPGRTSPHVFGALARRGRFSNSLRP